MDPEVVELNSDPENDDLIVVDRPRRHHELAEDGLVITGERRATQPLREQSQGLQIHLPNRVVVIPGEAPPRERATYQLLNQDRDRQLALESEARIRDLRRAQQLLEAHEERQRAQSVRRAGQDGQDPVRRRRNTVRRQQHEHEPLFEDYDDGYDSSEDHDYNPGDDIAVYHHAGFHGGPPPALARMFRFAGDGVIGRALMGRQPRIVAGFTTNGDATHGNDFDAIPAHVLRQVEESENAIMDQKRDENLAGTRVLRQNIRKELKNLPKGFSSCIDGNEEYVCVLCGVTLGVGISDDFKPGLQSKPFGALREMYDCSAPYQAVNYLTTADRDLSKRIFACSCGHVYCGRCVNGITNIKQRLQYAKSKGMKKTTMDINNPFIYSPLKCVAPDCKEGTRGRKKFVEIFL